jgi:hypothetical protein
MLVLLSVTVPRILKEHGILVRSEGWLASEACCVISLEGSCSERSERRFREGSG